MGKFTKGNPGRKKGSKNKIATRTQLSEWIDNNFKRFNAEMAKAKGARFCEIYLKAMEFCMPRYSSINFSVQNLSDDELRFFIEKIKEQMNEDGIVK